MRGRSWAAILYCLCFVLAASDELTLVVPSDVLLDYELLINHRPLMSIQHYDGDGARRDSVEVLLTQQALYRGGIREPTKFVVADSYSRILRLLESGEALLGATTVWANNVESAQNRIALSEELIPNGRFEAGFYTSVDNQAALAVSSLEQLRELHVVANPAWIVDWQTLQQLQFRHLEATPQWTSMVRMVLIKRVDVLLAPFQNRPDLSLHSEFGILYPIPKIKIHLSGTRHLPVSLKHSRGLPVLSVLNQGLHEMREDGTLERAYTEAGFYNPHVKNWKSLN